MTTSPRSSTWCAQPSVPIPVRQTLLCAALHAPRVPLRAAAARWLQAYVVNAPRIFSMIFKMVSPFLAADTKAKVRVFGKGEDHLAGKGGMLELVELDQIPQWLGGTSPTCAIPEPGGEESLD